MKKYLSVSLLALLVIVLSGTWALASQSSYTVKKGDCLWTISQSTGVSIDTIKKLNGLSANNLKIGQVLILSAQQTAPSGITPSTTVNNNSTSQYVVQAGDSLWSIAAKTGTTVQSIKQLNNLTSELLHPGDKLTISGSAAPVYAAATPSRAGDSVDGSRIIDIADDYLGKPYRYGGSGPNGFDCSGFTSYVFKQFSISLPRTAGGQYGCGVSVDKDNLQPGDLVFFACGGKGIDHVGIYYGDNKFIHSSSPHSGGVIFSSLAEAYYSGSYVGARRVLR